MHTVCAGRRHGNRLQDFGIVFNVNDDKHARKPLEELLNKIQKVNLSEGAQQKQLTATESSQAGTFPCSHFSPTPSLEQIHHKCHVEGINVVGLEYLRRSWISKILQGSWHIEIFCDIHRDLQGILPKDLTEIIKGSVYIDILRRYCRDLA